MGVRVPQMAVKCSVPSRKRNYDLIKERSPYTVCHPPSAISYPPFAVRRLRHMCHTFYAASFPCPATQLLHIFRVSLPHTHTYTHIHTLGVCVYYMYLIYTVRQTDTESHKMLLGLPLPNSNLNNSQRAPLSRL